MDVIKEDVFRKQIKKGLSGGYLLFGEEDYLKNFSLNAARSAVCAEETFAVFNDVKIDPLEYSPLSLSNALMAPPMMAEQKIVSINGLAISDMKSPELDELYSTLSTLHEYDYNVLIISVPSGLIDEGTPKKPSSVFAELSKYLTPVKFDAISGARLVAWIQKHFEHHGVSADAKVCEALIERCGKSMFTLSSETEKISYYILKHGRNAVTLEDIDNVSVSVISSDAYALANSILDGKHAEAIDALNVMKFRRIDPIIVLSEVSGVIYDLLNVKLLQSEGLGFSEILPISKMFSKPRGFSDYKLKLYLSAAASKPADKLKRALELCSEADLSLKSSMQGYEAIERLICSL